MNLADATKNIKKELSSDEKVLENVFKIETLYKKYKFLIWTFAIALVLFFIGRNIMHSMNEAKIAEANEAFISLQTKADDAVALNILKEKNPALFELYTFAQASKNADRKRLTELSTSSNEVISDLSRYTAATLEKKSSDTKLYKEMALLQEAYLAIKSGKNKDAKSKLELIDERSPLFMLASLLKHSTLKAK